MQVSMYVKHATVIFVPGCFLPSSVMQDRFGDARFACTLVIADQPDAGWAEVAAAMERDTYAAVSLARAITLLGAPSLTRDERPPRRPPAAAPTPAADDTSDAAARMGRHQPMPR